MHNANYTKQMNFNEEIFQLEIKSKKFSSEKQYLLFIDCLTMGT